MTSEWHLSFICQSETDCLNTCLSGFAIENPTRGDSHSNQYGKRARTKSQLSQWRWGMAAWSACAFLNGEQLLLSVWWVWYPDPTAADKLLLDHVQLRWTSPAAVPSAALVSIAISILHNIYIAAHAVSGQAKQRIQPPKAGIQPWKQLNLDFLTNQTKRWSIHQGWNIWKGMWLHI